VTKPQASLDRRLLAVFDEMSKRRSVTLAAETLGLSQPAVSVALARLREHFADPLFVRVGAAMEPTPLARELAPQMRQALEAFDTAFGYRSQFDPPTATRRFCISMSDISQVVLLPGLWAGLLAMAPGVSIEVRPLSQQTAMQLESGDADLAIGFMPQLTAGFYQQKLFPQRYVCVVRAGHPRIRRTLSRALYESESHIAVSAAGTGHAIVERACERQGVVRRISIEVPNYAGLSYVIQGTDLIATIPLRLAEIITKQGRLRTFELPVKLPGYDINLNWHERAHHDPGHRWMRSGIARLLRT